MMNAKTIQERLLVVGSDTPLDRLAELTVDALLETQLSEFCGDVATLCALRQPFEVWLKSPEAEMVLERLVAGLLRDGRTLREFAGEQLCQKLLGWLMQPMSCNRRLVHTVIGRRPVRRFVRKLLIGFLRDFGRHASVGMTPGLDALARMARNTVKAQMPGWANVVGVVGKRFEQTTEDLVDAALDGVFAEFVDLLSNPTRASEAAELRAAVLDGVLDLTMAQLARELIHAGVSDMLRSGLLAWLQSDALLQHKQDTRLLREFLEGVCLLKEVRALAIAVLTARMQSIFSKDAFASWLNTMLAEE